MELLPCPVCGKIPKIKTDGGVFGSIAVKSTIQCKSLFKKYLSLSIIAAWPYDFRATKEAAVLWNERVKEFKNGKSCKV